jgi:cephalosporin-C deacetylase
MEGKMNSEQLKELFSYKGSGIKPEDFDSFWDEKLEGLDDWPLNYTIEKVDFPSKVASCYKLTFESIDGAKITCQLLKPKNFSGKLPGMLQFHGYHVNSGDFSDKIGWVAEGNVVLAMDCRGQGGLSENKESSVKGSALKGFIIRGVEDGKHHLYYTKVFMDTVIASRILMELDEVDEENISVQGSSQGGALALVCASLEPKIKKVNINHPFLSDYRKAYTMDVQNSAYEELYYWFRFRDPLHEREDYFFNTLEYIDIQHFVSRIKASVIMTTGLADVVCFPITQFAAYNKLECPKKVLILPEYGHEHYPKIADKLRGYIINDEWEQIDSY